MDKIPVILSVRLSSSRLPRKCLLPLGNCATVMEFIISRIKNFGLMPIVFTSMESSDDEIEHECRRLNIPFFRGELENKLKRWRDGLSEFNLTWGHFADMDDPFLDELQINESVSYFHSNKLDLLRTSYLSDSGFASLGTSLRLTYLELLVRRSERLKHTNFDVIPWSLLVKNSDRVETFKDIKYTTRSDLRLTLDYKEDYELLNILATRLTQYVERGALEVFLENNPNLININMNRNEDFLKNKLRGVATFYNPRNDNDWGNGAPGKI